VLTVAGSLPRDRVGGIRYDRDEVIPLTAYRCPSCGFVEFYASPAWRTFIGSRVAEIHRHAAADPVEAADRRRRRFPPL